MAVDRMVPGRHFGITPGSDGAGPAFRHYACVTCIQGLLT
jgi:hypothetical protein